MFSDEIIDYINKLYNEYMETHLERPNYIKMPYYIFNILDNEYRKSIYIADCINSNAKLKDNNTIYTIFGMKPCLTKSIDNLEDMEVF